MKYYRKFHDEDHWQRIAYSEALRILLGTWKDNDMTRDMLTIRNRIHCMCSTIEVREFASKPVPDNVWNEVLMNVKYDADGNRL